MPDVGRDRPRPEWMAVVRVYGSILYATKQWGAGEGERPVPLEPSHVDGWMADCAQAGITTVLWRANCAGSLTYPSKFTALAGEPPLPEQYQLGSEIVEQGWRVADWEFLGEQCRRFDTLSAGVAAARRHGLKFFLDFSTFDLVGVWCTREQWPEGGERSFDPDLWLWSRDQRERLAGIPCYADPRVRERRLGEVAEALDYGIDGVFLGFFSHCDALSGEQRCRFGFNPVIVEEFRRRHGVDPLAEPVKPGDMYALHGEYFTQFVREAGALVRGAGRKLLCTTRTDGVHGWGGEEAGVAMAGALGSDDLRRSETELPLAAGFHLEWETWASEDLVDGLAVMAPFSEEGLAAAARMGDRSGKPVHLLRKFSAWEGSFGAPQSDGGYRREIQAVRDGLLNGYALHLMFIVDHPKLSPDWRSLLRA
jgi:hypothetical protein